jgi:hypothetical protein
MPLAAEAAVGPAEERRVVAAVFTDIVGSTASAEQLDPETCMLGSSPISRASGVSSRVSAALPTRSRAHA